METSRRDNVLDAATRLFAEQGFTGVSLQAIADAAKVELSEVGRLFGSEEKIYAAVLEIQFGLYTASIQAALEGNKLPVEKVEAMARAICDLRRQTPDLFPLFYRELLNPSQFFETIVKKNIRHVAFLSDNNIAKGIQKGMFKYEINPAHATMYLLGMLHYNFLASRLVETLLPTQDNADEYLNQALKVFLTGIQKG